MDHCRFTNNHTFIIESVYAYGFSTGGHPVGVVDHCVFENTRALVAGNLFVEDCVFTYTSFHNCIDSNYGGRYVFRYNDVTDAYVEAHSVQGANRSARSWEIYNNILREKNLSMWVPFFMRGGTGVIFNNKIEGDWTDPRIAVDNRRSCENLPPGGLADGNSPWDGNLVPGANAYPARDQIGRSKDAFLWVDSDHDGDWNEESIPSQALDPAYCWNNSITITGSYAVFFQHNCAANQLHIQENRDYYNNVQKPGYSPYTYPHPLIALWDNR